MIYFINLIMILNIVLFLNSLNPLILSIIVLMQTFCISMFIGLISTSFWFSYIIFLIFIGGMLILFIYVISMTFNNKFNLKFKNYFLLLFFIINISMEIIYFNQESNLTNHNKLPLEENSYNLIKLYNFPNNFINIMILNYLFYLMIIVVKITNFFYGPIRSKY